MKGKKRCLLIGLASSIVIPPVSCITTSCGAINNDIDIQAGGFIYDPLMVEHETPVKVLGLFNKKTIKDIKVKNAYSYDNNICEVIGCNDDTFTVKGISSGDVDILIEVESNIQGRLWYGVFKWQFFVCKKNTMSIDNGGQISNFDLSNAIDPNCFCVFNTDGSKKDKLIIPLKQGEKEITLSWSGDDVTYSENITSLHLYGKSREQSARIIHNGFLYGCNKLEDLDISDLRSLDVIEDNFLAYCTNFNQEIKLPKMIWSIGHYFMKNCTSYNKQVDLSPYPNLSLVCYGFMNGCDNFTSLNIGDVKEKEFDQDGAENDKYTLSTTNSSAIMYTTGVTVTGTEAEEFQIRFGDLTTGPEYRTIIV